jgi:hypothetical protein
MTRWLIALLAGLALAAPPAAAQSPQPAKPRPERAKLAHDVLTAPWTGDFDGMAERRLIRVLTVYSKTFFHAGVKYVRFMIDQYYKNEPMDDLNKGLFAFASYNAGPGRVAGLRKEAAKRGLDPNVWFHNVELVAAERIGRETVTYVSNIYKYYVAYTLVQGEYLERMEARKQFMAPR